MSRDSWRSRTQHVIREACHIWVTHNGSLISPSHPEAEKQRFMKMLRKCYPFGERSMYPYKVWCDEMKNVKNWLWPKVPEMAGLFAAPLPVAEGDAP